MALLLAALLDTALVPTRFVVGTLDEPATDALRAGWQAELPAIQARAVAVMQQATPTPAGATTSVVIPAPSIPPLPSDARAFTQARAAEMDARAARITGLLDAGLATIGDALGTAGVLLPEAPDPLPDRLCVQIENFGRFQPQTGFDEIISQGVVCDIYIGFVR